MKAKHAQLWLNQHYSEIKHWLYVGVLFILVIFALIQYSKSNQFQTKIDNQSAKIETLTKENNQLSKQNAQLNQKDINHTDCIAKVFARYTHDFVPVTIENLDNCTISSDTSSNTSVGTSSSSANQLGSSTPSSTSSASGQATSQGAASSYQPTPTPESPQPNIIQSILKGIRSIL